jgi:VWFA-related protein
MRKRFSNFLLCIIFLFCFFLIISCGGGGEGVEFLSFIKVSSNQIAFGDVILDSFSEQTITIENTRSSILKIGEIAQANPLSPPFSILNDSCSGKSLTASQTCTFNVRFSPTSQGNQFNDSFDIPSNDPNLNLVTVGVTGNGEALRISINQVTTTSCPDIDLLITVSDKNGSPISGLQPTNINLSENGVEKPIINIFPVLSPIPVSVAMALDYSDSLTPVLPNVEAASQQFIDLLNLDDEASIIKFAKEIQLKQPFTTNKNDLKSAILNDPYNGEIFATYLYDALWFAIDETATRSNNRSIVVISDGRDEDPATGKGSAKTLTQVINHAKNNEVAIFTIGLGDILDSVVMGQLANETGGQYFVSPNSDQLVNFYQEIRDILAGQYIIQYNSSSIASNSILLDVRIDSNGIQGDVSRQVQGCP